MIRAKMKCTNVNKDEQHEYVALVPVFGTSEENKTWSKYTPSGKLDLTISNTDAMGKLVPGKEYYVDISEAVPPPPIATQSVKA